MNHAFVLSEHYLVFCLGPILVRSLKFALGLTSLDGSGSGAGATWMGGETAAWDGGSFRGGSG